MRRTTTLAMVGLLALAGVGLTGCASDPADGAADFVQPYLDALASGDSEAAHDANPWSPALDQASVAASAAGEHLQIVEVGSFEEASDALAPVEVPTTEPAPTAEATTDTGWLGVDWSDSSWSGLDTPDDPLEEDGAEQVIEGLVPVTVALDGQEAVIPLGVAYGELDTGETVYAYREVTLTEEQAARWGTDTAGPALQPVAITLAITEAEAPEDTETSDDSWWEGAADAAEDAVDDATDAVTATTRAATISGAPVILSTADPVLILPGTYEVTVPDSDADSLWASAGLPAETISLLPGDEHTVTLGEAQATPAAVAHVQAEVQAMAQAQYDAMIRFEVSDRERSCGTLAPGAWGGGSSFEDGAFTTETTNLARGAISVTATSTNGATSTVAGNGNSQTFADESFCAGATSVQATTYTNPVTVTSSSLTPGATSVQPDGSWTTTAPWTLAMTTTVTSWGWNDASGTYVTGGIETTYDATVNITWTPTGSLTQEGTVEVDS